jgi:hypothetical protein
MPTKIKVAFDAYTLCQAKVDQQVYQDRLAAALPEHSLSFSIAPDVPMTVGFPFAINMISSAGVSPDKVMQAAETIWSLVINTARTANASSSASV